MTLRTYVVLLAYTFATLGLGMFIGSWISGKVVDAFSVPSAAFSQHMWNRIWIVPAIGAVIVLVLFAAFFHSSEAEAVIQTEEQVLHT